MGKAIAKVEKALASADESLSLKAALEVLDRGLGKAIQRVDASISSNETVTMVDERMLRMAAMRLLSTGAADVQEADRARAG